MKTSQRKRDRNGSRHAPRVANSTKKTDKKDLQLPRNALKATMDAALALLEGLNTPKSLAVAMLIRHDVGNLNQIKFNPSDYRETDLAKARDDYQAVALLKKASFLIQDQQKPRDAALKTWLGSELSCAKANKSLRKLWYDGPTTPEEENLFAKLLKARIFIENLLGPAPSIRDIAGRFGPGVTTLHKRDITRPKKYSKVICCTPELVPHVSDIVGYMWHPTTLLVVDGNTLSFVPKTVETDRPIAIEPDLNGYVQLGIGAALRQRLRRYLNLDDQWLTNRRMAGYAYWDGLATIDLSSASDSICEALVNILLPEDWMKILDLCRCKYTLFNGTRIRLEKYSSMGNGFTFELETIIFLALAVASGSDTALTTVFGDDIIVTQTVAPNVVETLEQCGFKVNQDKTFLGGLFYESCGADYFCGEDIRPIFWKTLKEVTHLYSQVNSITHIASRRLGAASDLGRDGQLKKAWSILCNLLKENALDFKVPRGFEDVGIVSPFDESTPVVSRAYKRGWGGFAFKAAKYRSDKHSFSRDYRGLVAALDKRGHNDQPAVVNSWSPNEIREWATGHPPSESTSQTSIPVRGRGCYRAGVYHAYAWDGPGPWL